MLADMEAAVIRDEFLILLPTANLSASTRQNAVQDGYERLA